MAVLFSSATSQRTAAAAVVRMRIGAWRLELVLADATSTMRAGVLGLHPGSDDVRLSMRRPRAMHAGGDERRFSPLSLAHISRKIYQSGGRGHDRSHRQKPARPAPRRRSVTSPTPPHCSRLLLLHFLRIDDTYQPDWDYSAEVFVFWNSEPFCHSESSSGLLLCELVSQNMVIC